MMVIPRSPPGSSPQKTMIPIPTRAALVAFVVLGHGLRIFAVEAPGGWAWEGTVKALAGGFTALPLGPELLDACELPGLGDLRLFDERGREVPRAIIRAGVSNEEHDLAATILNRENPTATSSRITVDFGVEVMKNEIAVRTAGANFRRGVKVEGSADQKEWAEILPSGWLFAVPGGPRYETLELGPNSHRFLRVTVVAMPEETGPPVIEGVQCRHFETTRPEELLAPAQSVSVEPSASGRESVLLLDFGRRHLPLAALRLTLAESPQRVFQRQCIVSGRNSLETEEPVYFETGEESGRRTVPTPWTPAGTGTITRDALEISVNVPFRYVQVIISNEDNPPLAVSGVVGVYYPVFLVFETAGQTRFTLRAGKSAAGEPRYEGHEVLSKLDPEAWPAAELGGFHRVSPVTQPVPQPGQALVWTYLGIVVAATLALLWWTATRPAAARVEEQVNGNGPLKA